MQCDETLPECIRCLQSGRKCPGPITGTFFVDMSGTAANASTVAESSAPDRREANSKPLATNLRGGASTPPSQLPIRTAGGSKGRGLSKPTVPPGLDDAGNFDLVAPAGDKGKGRSEALETAGHQLQLPSSYQPSRAAAFQQHFVSYLISSLSSPLLHKTQLRSWAIELPEILNAAGPTTIYSVRAAAMALYGIRSGDKSIQTDSCRWYAMGLSCQRSLLQKSATDCPAEMPTAEEICAPIMLSLFEVAVCTAPAGWIHHLSAATRMLEMRGPENCREGTVHTLFRTLRISSVFITVTTEAPSVFASDPWISIPFSLYPKSTLDKLIDILLQLPGCLARRNQMKALKVQNPHESEVIRVELKRRVLSLVSRLDEWLRQHEEELVEVGSESWQKHSEAGEENQDSLKATVPSSPSVVPINSLYHAANILAYRLLTVISSSHLYEWRITSHGNCVVSLAGNQSFNDSGGHGSLLMVFPLKVVCRLTRDEEQRNRAREMLEQLGRERGLDGICRRAAPTYLGRYQVEEVE
ncbi:hypothetical protein GP486_008070 [Trichoglossum hirsutum]|uniref:Zn(2)-C6 fungal-type domain-containing protein n=1 Tax=Trichoglossum hirsutum TaxID=265104 RepID=A0A9P8IAN7_9PEZI|nr:hypothetical protein GP486_008070 [Trichoglossum hirsutum]